jgi:hypothetical protein
VAKNRGRTSARFSGVITFASCVMLVRLSRPERLDDLRILPDEPRGRHPVVGGPLGQVELAGEEVEERAVPELHPPALAIEGRERDEEVGHGVVLGAEQIGKPDGVFTSGRHERTIARLLAPSVNAPGARLGRERDPPSRTPRADPERAQRRRRRAVSGLGAQSASLKRDASGTASTTLMGCANHAG